MPTETPLIDPRSYRDLVGRVADLAESFTSVAASGWKRPADDDPDLGWTLIRLFGRLAELAVARLNRVPEKSFLAFLDLIGAGRGTPQAARAPLTFHLAAGSPADALVPAGTQAAAPPLPGEPAPVLFETQSDLVVTRTQLTAVLVHEPSRDRWSDRTAVATGAAEGSFDPFQGDTPIEHALYLGHAAILGEPPEKDVILNIEANGVGKSWWPAVAWEVWDGNGWSKVEGNRLEITTSIPDSASEQQQTPTVWKGKVSLKAVPPVPLSTVEGRTASWMRARLTTPLPHGASEPLPTIASLQMSTHQKREGGAALTPDLGFSNQIPIDFKKDFFPFGEKPRAGDALYLASDEAFARPNASVKLHLVPTSPASKPNALPPPAAPADDLVLEWQAWNGREWTTFGRSAKDGTSSQDFKGFTDGTKRLSEEGDVTFTCPVVGIVDIGGEKHRWIRVRIARGGYGADVVYEPMTLPVLTFSPAAAASPDLTPTAADLQPFARAAAPVLPPTAAIVDTTVYRFVPPTFKPPSLRSVRLVYDYTSNPEAPQELLTVNDFTVWTLPPPPRFRDLATPFLDFIDFASLTSVARIAAMSAARLSPPPPAAFTPFVPPAEGRPTLYLGFARPGDANGFANRPATLYFGTEEALFDPAAEPPATAEAAAVVWEHWNGAAWQRLGTRDETQGFTRRGLMTFVGPAQFPASRSLDCTAFWLRARWERGTYAVAPRLRRVLLNTTWAVNARTITGEVLGSSRGLGSQTHRTRLTPVLSGQRLEVRELEPPSADEALVLATEEGDYAVRIVLDAAGQPAEVWVRWHDVPDFHASGPRSRHYTLDRASGEVLFGDGRRGLVPPPGTGNVLLTYQAGGGLAGNRPAGSVSQLKGTVPYVDAVSQPEPADGGAPEGSLESVKILAPKRLRHRDRAVALADFEDLAFEASPEVARTQGIGARDSSEAGTVALIVVPRTPGPKPVPSLELLERVRSYLEARLCPVVDLRVVGPDWLRVTVEAEVVPEVLEQATDVQNAVRARLAAFLHPLTGGPDAEGWAFGRKPYRSDLFPLLESTPGVDHVQFLRVTEEAAEGGARPGRFLIFSGEHRITLAGNLDEAAFGSAP